MRKVLLALCVAGLIQSAAYAELVGSWAKSVGATNTTYTLTITPTQGETMYGFDIAVFDNVAGPAFIDQGFLTYPDNGPWATNYNDFNSPTNTPKYTGFLVPKASMIYTTDGVDTSDIYMAGAAIGAGWTSALDLLHIVVPNADDTYSVNPVDQSLTGVSVMRSDEGTVYAGSPAVGIVGATRAKMSIVFVPEPTSLALLGCGLFGLLAYAWRKRK
jgi:hypothetical protein